MTFSKTAKMKFGRDGGVAAAAPPSFSVEFPSMSKLHDLLR